MSKVIWRFVGRSTIVATLLLLVLLFLELRSSVLLNTWTPPIVSAIIVAYLLYFIHAQARTNRSTEVPLSGWNRTVRHKLVNELTVVIGSLELMDMSEAHRINAINAAKSMRDSLLGIEDVKYE